MLESFFNKVTGLRFLKFHRKTPALQSFLTTLLKRDSSEIYEIFKNTFFYRTPPVSVFKALSSLIKIGENDPVIFSAYTSIT